MMNKLNYTIEDANLVFNDLEEISERDISPGVTQANKKTESKENIKVEVGFKGNKPIFTPSKNEERKITPKGQKTLKAWYDNLSDSDKEKIKKYHPKIRDIELSPDQTTTKGKIQYD